MRWLKCIWASISSPRAASFATVLQVVVVFASVIIIRDQLAQQARSVDQQARSIEQQAQSIDQQALLARAANTQALANTVAPFNLELAKNPELVKLLLRGSKGVAKVTDADVEKERYTNYLALFLIFYENMYAQHEKKLLDDDVYAGWSKDLETFVDQEPLEDYWTSWKDLYQAPFSGHVTNLISAKIARKAQPKQ